MKYLIQLIFILFILSNNLNLSLSVGEDEIKSTVNEGVYYVINTSLWFDYKFLEIMDYNISYALESISKINLIFNSNNIPIFIQISDIKKINETMSNNNLQYNIINEFNEINKTELLHSFSRFVADNYIMSEIPLSILFSGYIFDRFPGESISDGVENVNNNWSAYIVLSLYYGYKQFIYPNTWYQIIGRLIGTTFDIGIDGYHNTCSNTGYIMGDLNTISLSENYSTCSITEFIIHLSNFTIFIDETKPVIRSFNNQEKVNYSKSPFTFTWELYDQNANEYQIFIENKLVSSGFWSNGNLTWDIDISEIGIINITLVINDILGRITQDNIFLTIVDNIKPTISLFVTIDDVIRTNCYFNWEIYDDFPKFILVKFDGEIIHELKWSEPKINGTILLENLNVGKHEFEIFANDTTGNSISITRDINIEEKSHGNFLYFQLFEFIIPLLIVLSIKEHRT